MIPASLMWVLLTMMTLRLSTGFGQSVSWRISCKLNATQHITCTSGLLRLRLLGSPDQKLALLYRAIPVFSWPGVHRGINHISPRMFAEITPSTSVCKLRGVSHVVFARACYCCQLSDQLTP